MRVELFKGKGGWRLRLVGANSKTLAVSEAYYSKWNAKRAAKKNFPAIPLREVSRSEAELALIKERAFRE